MSSALAPVIEFLRRHAPFDAMSQPHLEFLAKRLRLGFYARGEVILSPRDGPAKRLYIIKQGRVRGEPVEGEGSSAWELVTGESFPIGALLSRRPTRLVQRAVEDTFCFELDRDDFDRLIAQSEMFHDFCTRRIANLLDNALRDVQARSARRISEENPLSTPVRALIRRAPVTCVSETPLGEALQKMQQAHVGSIAIVNEKQEFSGILTLHDILDRVVLPQLPLTTPIAEVMTCQPLTLASSALAWEATLLMAREGFGHLGVVEGRKLIGIISERDLFTLQRIRLATLSRNISDADDMMTLKHLQQDVHRLVEQMLAQGASVEQITQIITMLNDATTKRVITLVLTASGLPPTPFSWLAFGSEGRHEQTLKTDQDNGILFIASNKSSADKVREQLVPLAQRINAALAEVGFPLCPGGIMAGNPECCLSLEEWKTRFSRWIEQGTPEHLLKATIFFDFRILYGDSAPGEELRHWLLEKTRANSRFRRQMGENALGIRPPLGLLGEIRVASGGHHPHTIDLKLQGITPFVDAARIIALANNISATATDARLHAAVAAGALSDGDAAAWIDAYHFIQLMRMRHHRRQEEKGEEVSNHLDPDTLNELERRILKEAFRQARKLQSKLALDYQI
ncbi:MAG TPA: DUF294 nucleotidyltransferase-like domain-containing protein [Gammaproteobacteria bacterium]